MEEPRSYIHSTQVSDLLFQTHKQIISKGDESHLETYMCAHA